MIHLIDDLLLAILCISIALLSLATAGHALLHKRDPRSALVWVTINLALPVAGPFFYWCVGINRIFRRARMWQESGRRVSGFDIYPSETGDEADILLLPENTHLHELRKLEDRVMRTRLREGNRFTILFEGEEAYPAMLVAIRRARESINLSSYIFDGDGIGAEFADTLRAAADRGVEVRVIIDSLGEKYSTVPLCRQLAGSLVRVVRYLPLRKGAYINLRNHRKLLIVDGREAFTGGMNISSRHQPAAGGAAAVRDVHFSVQGPVVADLQRAFLGDWYFVTGERLDAPLFFPPLEPCGNGIARAISDGPDQEFRKLEQVIMGALSCARSSVSIMTPYFIPDRPLLAALITAALRGVAVRIVLPGCNNLPFVHWASRSLLRELVACDVRVYYQPAPFVHSKLMVVDGAWSLIGSANLDTRSLRLNFELDMAVYDTGFACRIERHFESSLAASREVTLQELDGDPIASKLRNNFMRLFSPYL